MDGLETELQRDRARVVRLCGSLTGDWDAAEDLAQETLLVAWRNLHKLYAPELRFKWLAGIARNICRAWMQRQRRGVRPPAAGRPGGAAPPPPGGLAGDF